MKWIDDHSAMFPSFGVTRRGRQWGSRLMAVGALVAVTLAPLHCCGAGFLSGTLEEEAASLPCHGSAQPVGVVETVAESFGKRGAPTGSRPCHGHACAAGACLSAATASTAPALVQASDAPERVTGLSWFVVARLQPRLLNHRLAERAPPGSFSHPARLHITYRSLLI